MCTYISMFNGLNKAFEASLVYTMMQPKRDCLRKRSSKLKQTELVSLDDPGCQKQNKVINQSHPE